jgi:chromosome segregation ATPase
MYRAPNYFDVHTLSQENTSNWAVKSANLRKLLRNLESYFHAILVKTTNFDEVSGVIADIAKNQDLEAIASFVELIIAAAVTCEDRSKYIGWIMEMEEDNQIEMKSIIETSLARLEDFDASGVQDESGDVDDEMDGSDHFDGEQEMSGFFRNAMQNLDSATQGMDVNMSITSDILNVSTVNDDIVKERDQLRVALAEAKRNAATLLEDNEVTQNKLRDLVSDLQNRLDKRQEELTEVEEKMIENKRSLEDAEGKISDLMESNRKMADELDVANDKARQLSKAEATVAAYRKKLENSGMMNQQMVDMENQTSKYLSQIMELELKVKKIPELQSSLDDTTRELHRVQKEKNALADKAIIQEGKIAQLKTDLSALETAKKMADEELEELRAVQSAHESVDQDINTRMQGLSLQQEEYKKKIVLLQDENKELHDKLANARNLASEKTIGDSAIQAYEEEISELKAELERKEARNAKLASDKDKLEMYTKKTLSKFQEKYLVALQECKAKLKEKHDKIEQLELRSAAEKTSRKREETLLSSTIYELGLTIMQQIIYMNGKCI